MSSEQITSEVPKASFGMAPRTAVHANGSVVNGEPSTQVAAMSDQLPCLIAKPETVTAASPVSECSKQLEDAPPLDGPTVTPVGKAATEPAETEPMIFTDNSGEQIVSEVSSVPVVEPVASFGMAPRDANVVGCVEQSSAPERVDAPMESKEIVKIADTDVKVFHQNKSGSPFRGKGALLDGIAVGENLPTLTDTQTAFLEKAKHYSLDQSIKTYMLRKAIHNQQLQMVALKENIQKQQALTVMCTLYVGSISYECKEENLKNSFGQFGPVRSANMTWDPSTGRHMGFSFVEFEVPEAAELALNQMNGVWLAGRNIRVGRPANQPQAQQTIDQIHEEARKFARVYVANIHPELNEDDLKSVFEAFGHIKSVTLPRDQNPTLLKPGRHRGYAFIEYVMERSATEAVGAMNNFEVGGQSLKVGRAITPPENASKPIVTGKPASSAFVPALSTPGIIGSPNSSSRFSSSPKAGDANFVLPPPGVAIPQPQVITPKLYSVPAATAGSERRSRSATPVAAEGKREDPASAAPTSVTLVTTHTVSSIASPLVTAPLATTSQTAPITPVAQQTIPAVGTTTPASSTTPSSSSGSGAAADAASRAAQLMRSSDAVAQMLLNSGALSEKQKQLIEGEVSQSLAAQEDLKIKGNEARSVLMQKLMRRLESPVLVLRNMVGPEDLDEFIEEEINDECAKFGQVMKIVFYQEQGRNGQVDNIKIFVKFSLPSEAETAKNALNGRYFGGRTVKAEIYDLNLFNSGDLTA